MNTSIAAGYGCGAISGLVLLRYVEVSRLFFIGLSLAVLSILLTGVAHDFEWLFIMRLLSGLGTAWSFSCGGAIVTFRYADESSLRGYAVGAFFGCAGLGMILTAMFIPELVHAYGNGVWQHCWLLLGLICAALASYPIISATRHPVERGHSSSSSRVPLRGTYAAMVAYIFYAIGQTAYLFFVFAWLRSQDVPWRLASFMWMAMGASIMASPFLWQGALNRWRANMTLSACYFLNFLGSAIPLCDLSLPGVMLSAVLLGSSAFIGPSAMATLARQALPPSAWSSGIMIYTITFAVGQAIGSWLSGWVADVFSLRGPVILGAAALLISTVIVALRAMSDPSPARAPS